MPNTQTWDLLSSGTNLFQGEKKSQVGWVWTHAQLFSSRALYHCTTNPILEYQGAICVSFIHLTKNRWNLKSSRKGYLVENYTPIYRGRGFTSSTKTRENWREGKVPSLFGTISLWWARDDELWCRYLVMDSPFMFRHLSSYSSDRAV